MKSPYPIFLRWVTVHGARRWWLKGVEGLHHVPRQGPCMVIANHASYLDFMILSAVFELDLGHILRFWVSERISRHWFFRHYCGPARCLEVSREGIKAAWRESVHCLSHGGDFLCVFPEGTRTRTGQLQSFRLGYLRLAAECQAPMVPVRLENAFDAWPPHRLFPRRTRINLVFHEPVVVPRDLSTDAMRVLNQDLRRRCFGVAG